MSLFAIEMKLPSISYYTWKWLTHCCGISCYFLCCCSCCMKAKVKSLEEQHEEEQHHHDHDHEINDNNNNENIIEKYEIKRLENVSFRRPAEKIRPKPLGIHEDINEHSALQNYAIAITPTKNEIGGKHHGGSFLQPISAGGGGGRNTGAGYGLQLSLYDQREQTTHFQKPDFYSAIEKAKHDTAKAHSAARAMLFDKNNKVSEQEEKWQQELLKRHQRELEEFAALKASATVKEKKEGREEKQETNELSLLEIDSLQPTEPALKSNQKQNDLLPPSNENVTVKSGQPTTSLVTCKIFFKDILPS